MALDKSHIPYGAYWSTPFCRWQGSLAEQHALKLAADVAKKFLADRAIAADKLDGVVLGITVPQKQSFYGAPWLTGLMGLEALTGPTVSQACATSVRAMATAAAEVECGMRHSVLAVACDRTSNGPHVYYPSPGGPGGTGDAENTVLDNFQRDPHAGFAMVGTAENVAKAADIGRGAQDEMTLLRYQQYQAALESDRAFQKRYMVGVSVGRGKAATTIDADEGIFPTSADGLAKLKPVMEGGSVTFGSQTHPADGNAGMIICDADRARELARDPKVPVRIVGFGDARVAKGMMPMAVVPAARAALAAAGVKLDQCAAVKTHNPFAVNDVYFCREMGLAPDKANNFGSPLVFGHPQGPTGLRAVIELIEELQMAGGGYGLFSGCAAGDTAMAVVIKVG